MQANLKGKHVKRDWRIDLFLTTGTTLTPTGLKRPTLSLSFSVFLSVYMQHFERLKEAFLIHFAD